MAITKKLFPSLFLPLALSLGVFTATGLVGCSTNSADQAGENADAVPPPDAGTDAVPQAAAEDPAAPPTAPVADASAPPPPQDVASADATPAPPPEAPTTPPPPMDATPPVAAAPVTPDVAIPPQAAPEVASAPVPAPAPVAPVPVAAPPVASSSGSSGSGEDYTVQRGDTLMKIAFENYGDLYKWKEIYENNHDRISNPNSVPPGTVLKLNKPAIPVALERNGDQYLIKTGDTLGTISTDVYGVKSKWKRLWENNKQLIKDPNKIYAGFYLFYTLTPSEREDFNNRKNGTTAPQPLAGADDAQPQAQPQANSAPAAAPPVAAPAAAPPQPVAVAPAPPAEVRDPASVKPAIDTAKK